MEKFYIDIGKSYNDIVSKYSVDFFSISIYNNWLFFFIGFISFIVFIVLFILSDVISNKLESEYAILKSDDDNSKFLSLSLIDLNKINFNSKNFLGKNERVDSDFLCYLKTKSYKKKKFLFDYLYNFLIIFFSIASLCCLIYSTIFLWIYENNSIEKEFKIIYTTKVENLEPFKTTSEIIKMEPIILTKEYLEREFGEAYTENLNVSNNSYVYHESYKELPGYKIVVKTNDKIENLFVYESDIIIHSLEESNKDIPFVSYNNFGNLDNLSEKYNIKELENLNSLDYVQSGLKNIQIYLPKKLVNDYINKEKIVIE